MNKQLYAKITLQGGGIYIQSINELGVFLDEIKEAAANGEARDWSVSLIEMTPEEYESLPEFTGH